MIGFEGEEGEVPILGEHGGEGVESLVRERYDGSSVGLG